MSAKGFWAQGAHWIVTAGVSAVVGLLVLSGGARLLELKTEDMFTRLVPPPPHRPDVAVIDVDDNAIQAIGTWPWSRDIHAGLLADLRSLGTGFLTFDVEFVDRGPVGVNSAERDAVLAAKDQELDQVFQALRGRQLKTDEAYDAAKTLLGEGILLTARDNDALLGQALQVFGQAFTTLNYGQPNDNADAREAAAYLAAHSSIGPVSGRTDLLPEEPYFRGAIVPIAGKAAGAGVTNVEKDPDGTLRRIHLLFRVKGSDQIYGQLAFVPVWNKLGRPSIVVEPGRIVLRTSLLAVHSRPDLVVPLDPDGALVINWPHGLYGRDDFIHVGAGELLDLRKDEGILEAQVAAMGRANYLADDLESAYDQARADRAAALAAGDQKAFDDADLELDKWREAVQALVSGSREADLQASLSAQAQDPKVPLASREKIPGLLTDIGASFGALKAKAKAYFDLRKDLLSRLAGALTFYGWTSAATTDLGVTPFDSKYVNVGTHAAIASTILTGAYLNEWPGWAAFLLGLGLSWALALVLFRVGTLSAVLVGFGTFVVLVVSVGAVYSLTGVYPGALVPGLTVFFTALGLALVKFWGSEAEKRFIRGAFGTYLSPEVIKQLEADPEKLHLGGEKKVLTAMFTDVKGFSTFSEKLDPNDLVALLNQYLTGMSDIILDAKGTIDKFEGDAIIAFFGAPLTLEDHAQRAVQAALRMKAAEAGMNERFQQEGLAPGPLLTRIGINTGEMTVGNMGTTRRMDYTMMGNSVNLAARLEGVNKEYGTWVLTTEATRGQLDQTILVRKLDRVRVVGIRTPVRLFEVQAFRDDAPGVIAEKTALFEEGIDAYETRDWDTARKYFDAVLALDPTDGPARTFVDRTAKLRTLNLGADWDGVFTLTSK